MVRFFVSAEDLEKEVVSLTGENAQHAKVLRLKPGETVLLCDGEGREAVCKVASTDGWLLRAMERRESQSEAAVKVSVYMALPKADKLEHVIQKATEMMLTAPAALALSLSERRSWVIWVWMSKLSTVLMPRARISLA